MTLVIQAGERDYDLAIIGAGVAGLSLALQLEQAGKKVLVIESGGEDHDPQIQEYSHVEAEGDLPADHFPNHAQRAFGGTSRVWAGYCAVLEKRSFLTNGWPIDYEALAEHYPAAAGILDLAAESYLTPALPIGESGRLVYKPFFRSPPTLFYEKYFERFVDSADVDLLLNHTVIRLTRERDRIVAATLQGSKTGDRSEARAGAFVVACGGLGNPRVLLQSGLTDSAAVGRYLMEHPHFSAAGRIEFDARVIEPVMGQLESDRYHALQLADSVCVANGFPSLSAQFHSRTGEALLFGERTGVIASSVFLRAEMLPAPTNRFSLSSDAAGPGPNGYVHLRFPRLAYYRQAWDLMAEILLREGIGRLSPLRRRLEVNGGGHLVGTTRMGKSAADSVVDADARVHGLDNLYVAGSSLFPYSAAANPTFTLVALAVRLGKHLRGIL